MTKSVRTYGAGRAIVVDAKGRTIGGAKTLAGSIEAGLTDAIVVPTDGTRLVVVQRTDLDFDVDERAAALGLTDNRASEVGLQWDPTIVDELVGRGVDVSALWTETELAKLTGAGAPPADTSAQMGRLEFRIIVECRDEAHQTEMLTRFEQEGVPCRALIS